MHQENTISVIHRQLNPFELRKTISQGKVPIIVLPESSSLSKEDALCHLRKNRIPESLIKEDMCFVVEQPGLSDSAILALTINEVQRLYKGRPADVEPKAGEVHYLEEQEFIPYVADLDLNPDDTALIHATFIEEGAEEVESEFRELVKTRILTYFNSLGDTYLVNGIQAHVVQDRISEEVLYLEEEINEVAESILEYTVNIAILPEFFLIFRFGGIKRLLIGIYLNFGVDDVI